MLKFEQPTSEQVKAAWQKCEDAWQAAGAPSPCYEENYMKAREEYAELLKRTAIPKLVSV